MTADLERVRDEAEARQLPALIADWTGATGPRGRIARALRIDLALLEARPELALACAYRRAPFDDAHLIARPWLRGLRRPIDDGTREEYRTGAEGPIAFSADGALIGVVGEIAWERVTGRRAGPRLLVAPRARRWEHDAQWGAITLRSDSARFELAFSDDEYPANIYELDDAHLLFRTYEDGPDAIHLVNVEARQLVWSVDGKSTGAVLAGGRVVVLSTDAVTSYALADGRLLARQHPGGTQIAVAADGTVAVRDGHVVRVCDLDARSTPPAGVHGWTAAMFSPSSRYLLTGRLLCDARTGSAIATLPLNRPEGWLMGNPPHNCQYVADDLVLELIDDLVAWRTSDGAEALRYDGLRALNGIACWSRNATRLAVVHRDGGLAVYDPRQRRLMAEHDIAVAQLAFAGDVLVIETVDARRLRVADTLEPWHGELPAPPDEPHVRDGLVGLAGAAIPIDDDHAVLSPDRRYLAGRTAHYALDG